MAIETQNRVVYEEEPARQETHAESRTVAGRKSAAGGIAFAATLGLAAMVLAVLGLVDISPLYMAAIGSMLIGTALLLEGGFTFAWFTGSRTEYLAGTEGGISAELVGGIAGIVLGVLALIGISPEILLPVSVLALGSSLFLAGWSGFFGGAKLFIGLSAMVLGVLALIGFVPMVLCLTGFLCLGCVTLLSGSAFSGKLIYAAQA